MIRLFSWLDDAFSQLVPLAYLAGGVASAVTYLGGAIPNPVVAVGICMGFAVELHFWLQQRRLRASYAMLARLPRDDAHRDMVLRQFRGQIGLMVALGLFSAWNSNMFLASYWHPVASVIPAWIQSLIRASIIPVLFWMTSSLTPLTEDPSAYLSRSAQTILRKTLRATVKQMRQRIIRARQCGADLVPITIALLLDAGDAAGAKRLQLISEGIAEAESEEAVPFVTDQPPWMPTGPGSPCAMPDTQDASEEPADPIPMPTRRSHKRNAAQANAEARIRTLLARKPEMPMNELARRARVSFRDAGYWRRKILDEMAGEYAQ